MPGQKTLFLNIFLLSLFSMTSSALMFLESQQNLFFKDDVEQFGNRVAQVKIERIEFPVQKSKNSSENFIRKGILITRPQALGTVVICHGFTQSKHEAAFFRTLFPHFNVLAFDFRAHGELTEGQYSTIGGEEAFDVKGAVDYVKKQFSQEQKPIIGFGFSMGAVSLLQSQSEYPNLFDALILDSPFDSSTDCMSKSIDKMLTVKMFGQKYQIPGKKLMMKCLYSEKMQPAMRQVFRYAAGFHSNVSKTKFVPVNPIDGAKNISVPCFFITCERDQKVPVGCVRNLYNSVNCDYKRLWITHGIRHCGSFIECPEQYVYRVNKFISDFLDKSWSVPEEVYDDRIMTA